MDEKKTMLIVNPASGVNSKEGIAEKLADKLQDMGRYVTVAMTQRAGHASLLASEAVEAGFGSVVVCGGDGTVNEAASALCGTGVAMGIVPSGSGNGLARHLGIPVDEIQSLKIIENAKIALCDCGMVSGTDGEGKPFIRRFFTTFGIGFDAEVSAKFAHAKRRGRITYIKTVMETVGKYKPLEYRLFVNGTEERMQAMLVAFCNASQYGNNAFIAPKASVSDGMLDVVAIKSGNALKLALAGFDVMAGLTQYNHGIETSRASHAIIDVPTRSAAHIDGEPCMIQGSITVRCQPSQLKVYSGNYGKVVPLITPIEHTARDWAIAVKKLFVKL